MSREAELLFVFHFPVPYFLVESPYRRPGNNR